MHGHQRKAQSKLPAYEYILYENDMLLPANVKIKQYHGDKNIPDKNITYNCHFTQTKKQTRHDIEDLI